jgi:hypothetical protein
MVYGIIGMINFAHGEIYMIGAYVGLVTLTAIGVQPAIPCRCCWWRADRLGAGHRLYGWPSSAVAYRPLRGGPRLVPLISPSACPSSCRTTCRWPGRARHVGAGADLRRARIPDGRTSTVTCRMRACSSSVSRCC